MILHLIVLPEGARLPLAVGLYWSWGFPEQARRFFSQTLRPLLNAVHFNADEVRAEINRDLGFSLEDRIEQARRMSWLCAQVVSSGNFAIADFVCPTRTTREAFGSAFVVWVDRIKSGRFEDTNRLFEPPLRYDLRVTPEGTPRYWAEKTAALLMPPFDPKAPTALFVGRYQPFHEGHFRLISAGIERVGQACIAVRDTQGTDAKNPFYFEYIKSRIDSRMRAYAGRYQLVSLPNITHIFYGRDVGYRVERIELDAETETISATGIRRAMRAPQTEPDPPDPSESNK